MKFMFFKQVLRDMRGQKLRSALTLFGIFWGTTAIIFLGAFGHGIHEYQVKSFKGLGEDIVIMWPGRTSMSHEGLPKGRRITFKPDDAKVIKSQIPEVSMASIEYQNWNVEVKYGKVILACDVSGVYPEFGDMRNIIPDWGGRFLNDIDQDDKRRVCFLGDQLAKDLFGEEGAAGKSIMIQGVPFTVIGVMINKPQDSSYSGRDKDKVFMAASTSAAMFGHIYPDVVIWKARSPEVHSAAKDKVKEVLGTLHGFDPADKEAIWFWDTTEGTEFFTTFFWGFRIFLLLISFATLVVGGIGIANIMYVVVKERSREIGLKMALGAKKSFVLGQFILETLFMTFLGGATGLAFALSVISIFPQFKLEEYVGTPSISSVEATVTVGLLFLIGLMAGFFPARRAANLNPVQSLKM